MKTATIQIGNSDDKLTQSEWSDFVSAIKDAVQRFSERIHFLAAQQIMKNGKM